MYPDLGVLLAIDIGLLVYFLVLYLQVKRMEVREKISNALIESILSDDTREKVLDTRRQLLQRLGKRYKPLYELLGQQLRYLSVLLLVYNITVGVYFLFSLLH